MRGTKPARVGDYIEDRETKRQWTVAAVFETGTIMTAGQTPLYLNHGEYRVLQRCDDDKHERDLVRFAYAEPNYMKSGDPRALVNRSLLEKRDVTTMDAREILQDAYLEDVRKVGDEIVALAQGDAFETFPDMTKYVQECLDETDWTTKAHKVIETIYISPSRMSAWPSIESMNKASGFGKIARKCYLEDLKHYLVSKTGPQIDLTNPKTLNQFKDDHED